MTNADDKNLKAFLQRYQPEPETPTTAESEATLRMIEHRLQSEGMKDSKSNGRVWFSFPSLSGSWLGASGFVAATLIASVITTKTISQSPNPQLTSYRPTPVASLAESTDGEFDLTEEETQNLDVGQDWLDLVASY